jgi:hypothetical protein
LVGRGNISPLSPTENEIEKVKIKLGDCPSIYRIDFGKLKICFVPNALYLL